MKCILDKLHLSVEILEAYLIPLLLGDRQAVPHGSGHLALLLPHLVLMVINDISCDIC